MTSSDSLKICGDLEKSQAPANTVLCKLLPVDFCDLLLSNGAGPIMQIWMFFIRSDYIVLCNQV